MDGKVSLFLAFDVPACVDYFYRTANQLLERELDIMPMTDRIPAHLTVKTTFSVPETDVGRVIGLLDTVIARVARPIRGYLDDLDDFNQGVVHIPVNGDQVKALIVRILSDFESFTIVRRPNEGMCPHITIAKGFPKERLASIKRLLQERLECPKGEVPFDTLRLYRKEENIWQPLHALKLRAMAA